jgi:hypothetical protein
MANSMIASKICSLLLVSCMLAFQIMSHSHLDQVYCLCNSSPENTHVQHTQHEHDQPV